MSRYISNTVTFDENTEQKRIEKETSIFNKFSDSRYSRRRSVKKSIDVNAIQSAMKEMGYNVSMVEIFDIMKEGRSEIQKPGQLDYKSFQKFLINIRHKKGEDVTLISAFTALGAKNKDSTLQISKIAKSVKQIKTLGIDTTKFEHVISQKSEDDQIDFFEFAACFDV